VSELQLNTLQVGQAAQVKLDAFPDRVLNGQIARISPAADPTARLIPIEITLPNPGGQLGSGLLARVQFQSPATQQVIVPESAFVDPEQPTTLFVVEQTGEQPKAVTRSVQVGETRNGQVEIRSGLKAGESFIVRSSGVLKNNQAIRLSILSEPISNAVSDPSKPTPVN
jgi:RND family efflux transporter MFP subunit